MQCSWVRRLYDYSLQKWKIIPLRLIKNALSNSLKFYSDMIFNRHHVNNMLLHYDRNILLNCKKYFSQNPEVPCLILS